MSNNIPLSVLMENTKGKFTQAFNQVLAETQLPAYLIEGMLLELLAEVRNQKNRELILDINAMQSKEEKPAEKEEKTK